MTAKRLARLIAMSMPLLHATVYGLSCGWANPLKFFSRHACDILNCDTFFFLEEIFPLSGRPSLDSGVVETDAGEEGGGHLH